MEIPLWAFLVPFALVALVTSIYVFFNLYHLYAFGVAKHGTRALMALYVGSYIAIGVFSASFLLTIDWSQSLSVQDLFSGSSSNSKNRILDL